MIQKKRSEEGLARSHEDRDRLGSLASTGSQKAAGEASAERGLSRAIKAIRARWED
jgi:hypothetical protein